MPVETVLPGRTEPNGSQRVMADWTPVWLTVLCGEPSWSVRAEYQVPACS